MLESLLHRIAFYARAHWPRIFVVSAVVLATSLALTARLEVDTEILNMLPQDDPVVQRFRETLEVFGSLDVLLVVVEIPQGAVLEPYLSFADALAPRLEELEEIEYVDFNIGEIEDLVAEFFPNAFLFLDGDGREQLAERLSDPAIRERAVELRRQLQTPQAIALQDLYLLDPLGISEVFLDQLVGTRGDLRVDWSRGYFLSTDREMLLMVAKPTAPAQEIEFDRRLVAAVDGAVERTLGEWLEIAEGEELEPPSVSLGGTYVIALSDAGTLFRDVLINAVTSMIAVLVLFWVAFRRLSLLLYAFVPLASGLIVAAGFAALTLGRLNAFTSGFAALLVGLGIDFVIVSYGRYVEERSQGRPLDEALRAMTGSSGRAVVTGGVTTAATFYAFLVTEFTGLREMGFLIGTGIFFCMAAVLVLLPAMLAWREDHPHGGIPGWVTRLPVLSGLVARRAAGAPRLYLHGFGSSRLIRWSYHHPAPVLVVALVLSIASAMVAPRLEFVDSIRSMRPEGNAGVLVQDRVSEKFGSGFDYMMLVVAADTQEAVLERTAEVAAAAGELIEQGVLLRVDSIDGILPAPSQQRQGLAWMSQHRGDLLDPERLRASFDEAARAAGLRPEGFARGIDLLTAAAAREEVVTLDDLGAVEETRRLLDRYVREVDGGWRSVVYLHPPPRVAKREAPPAVVDLADRLGDDVTLSGVNTVSERLREQVKSDAVVAAVVGFVVVALMLWVDYRNPVDAALSLAPLVVGILWMLGGMAAFGIDMNFFNVFVTTMIIGIGVDYGVHMVHRFREAPSEYEELRRHTHGEGTDRFLAALQETGKAIVLAALSTSVGFGSLSLSRYPGLRSMGFVAIMGALLTALVAITVLPALFGSRLRRRLERGRDAEESS
ncbi:MAG: hypothetical protein DWQ36_01155 [Acidobacteria bacterium]|nr:MAG: hypothetical protein DWQ30_13945 [Acidobacteriota bacterium]REK11622.1 MAG: hypothetical protein DWQ36_01155 [Acidobacteriota bacterium]